MVADSETLALIRSAEPDRYLAALAAPPEAREDLLALAAFAAAIRRSARQARDPLVGEIRLTWWREALERLAEGSAAGHPIADALAALIARGAAPLPRLTAFIDAQAFDLSPAPFADEQARGVYLRKTEGMLFRLGLARLGDDTLGEALVEKAARAYGLSRAALRLDALAPLVTHADLAASGATIESLASPQAQRARDRIARRLAEEAGEALAALAGDLAALAPDLRPALLPLVMAPLYLRWAVGNGPPATMPLRRVWRIWRASRSGRLVG